MVPIFLNINMTPIKQKKITSFDGTKITYYVIGKGKKPMVLCNGLGGNLAAWKLLYQKFTNDYRFITWDYRGLFKSDPPQNEQHLGILDHVKDLEIILSKEKVDHAVFAGWSMGVQICLEFYRDHSDLFEGMILINGTFGYPFHTVLNNPLLRYVLPRVNEIAKKVTPAVQPTLKPLANKLINSNSLIQMIQKMGLAHENMNIEVFQEVARDLISIDFNIYHQIMRHLSEHNAGDVLPIVRVPVLIITGEKDIITPRSTAERMAHTISKSELFILPYGSHYALLEFPDIINARMGQFLREHYPSK
ncbi:MAG TPA: hypothetical protein DDW49_07685 [Deltaproteobacteria bacterium]|nr:MAG: hypothetical protein A2048_02230 [Deltaproteobacteria bacterium GWA2_45_12]HBF13250.1 hypothetical protein [Deltaproteobacteria bacterium]